MYTLLSQPSMKYCNDTLLCAAVWRISLQQHPAVLLWEQAKELKSWGADGVIVGSALVRALGEASSTVGFPPVPMTTSGLHLWRLTKSMPHPAKSVVQQATLQATCDMPGAGGGA